MRSWGTPVIDLGMFMYGCSALFQSHFFRLKTGHSPIFKALKARKRNQLDEAQNSCDSMFLEKALFLSCLYLVKVSILFKKNIDASISNLEFQVKGVLKDIKSFPVAQ